MLRDAVKAILTHMTNPSSATALSLASTGERLAVIVNNLGGTSKLEELVRRDMKQRVRRSDIITRGCSYDVL